jgi:maltose-binding protein MalE
MPEETLDATQAAEVLEVTPDRIAVLVEEGLLTPLPGRDDVAFDPAEVRAVNLLGG